MARGPAGGGVAGGWREAVREAARGAILGVTAWLLLAQLGVPDVLRIGELSGLLPSLVVGAALGLLGRGAWLWGANGLGVAAVAAIVATPEIPRRMLRPFVREDRPPAAGVQAVVVLGAKVTADGALNPTAADRLLAGLAYVRAHAVPLLVTTRVRSADDPAVTSDADQARLVALAATGARWIVTPAVFDTRDEAREVAAIAAREGFARVAVVTSASHTSRACAVFERAGLTVTCVAAFSRESAVRGLRSPRDRLVAFRRGLYEAAGWTWYRLRGWL